MSEREAEERYARGDILELVELQSSTPPQQDHLRVPEGPQLESGSSTTARDISNEDESGGTCRSRYRISKQLFAAEPEQANEDNEYPQIEDPFRDWLPDQVKDVAQRVACEYGLDDLQGLFIKAARVLKDTDPMSWSSWDVEEESELLTKDERICLQLATTAGFWDQPWPLHTTFLMLFIAAIVQGWSQTGTNGANLSWWTDLHISNPSSGGTGADNCTPGSDGIWIYAVVNAASFLAASLGSYLSDPLINELLFGRRGAILLSALLVFGSSIGGAFTQEWWQLLICRIVLGIGMGCKAAVVPVFAAEIAPAHLRGSLVMNWQVFDALGICLGYSANLIASRAGYTAWRWQIFSSAIPSFALWCGAIFVCWDSPRYLMKHETRFRAKYERRRRLWEYRHNPPEGQSNLEGGKHKSHRPPTWWEQSWQAISFRSSPSLPYRSEAFRTLVLLRGHPIVAAKELLYAHCQLLVETRSSQSPAEEDMDFSLQSRSSWLGRFADMFSSKKRHIRRELYAAAVVMAGQQLTGVNVLIFYSSILYCESGHYDVSSTAWQPLLLTWGIGAMNVIFALPAYWLIDTKGRRWLLLATIPFLAVTMAAAAAGFTITNPTGKKAVVTTFTYLYMVFYSPGMGPVPFTLSAEVFPLEHRMVGMSLVVSLNFLGAGLETLFAPLISNQSILLGAFAVLNVFCLIFVWVFVREVSGSINENRNRRMTWLNLEELYNIFEWPTKVHLEYQWTQVLPYFCMHMKFAFLYCSFLESDSPPEAPKPFRAWAADKYSARSRQSSIE